MPEDTESIVSAEESLEPVVEPVTEPTVNNSWIFVFKLAAAAITLFLVAGSVFVWYINHTSKAPVDFPINQPVTIEAGTGVKAITEQLEASGVVRSAQLLYWAIILVHDPADIKASTYVFDEPVDLFAVARRLTEGDFDTDLMRFTHFEGERASAIAIRAADMFPNFNLERFLASTTNLEGKLFPDTYFVPPTFTDIELLELMQETYSERMMELQPLFASSTYTEDEVIIIASILEREANTPESMKLVAGILDNRLSIGMALQTDAAIEYVIETPLGQLPEGQLASELRELDSPYNTYLYPGLPPTPIGNPGLDAITAVLQPTPSEYFYYLTDEEGNFYYSETYDEHLRNIELHL